MRPGCHMLGHGHKLRQMEQARKLEQINMLAVTELDEPVFGSRKDLARIERCVSQWRATKALRVHQQAVRATERNEIQKGAQSDIEIIIDGKSRVMLTNCKRPRVPLVNVRGPLENKLAEAPLLASTTGRSIQ